MKIKVLNKRDTKLGISIDRGSIWGNPYSHRPSNFNVIMCKSREEAIAKYREYIKDKIDNRIEPYYSELQKLRTILKETGELNLLCWCKPLACHGDIIAELILDEINGKEIA